MSEFDLIQRYFTRATPGAILGVGDDAALLKVGAGMELAVSTDMLVCGTHFFPDADPLLLGHKTLAVNLSDLAAMGATPRWATLALSLPAAEEGWLEKFSRGFFSLAQQHGVELIGGDTTRGPLNMSVTVMGEVPEGTALRRDRARVGDDIWVSGSLGDAALALAHLQGRIALPADLFASCAQRLHQPQPRVALGLALRGMAHSAIDVSDGLLADLGHILERSRVGAEIEFDALPRSTALNPNNPLEPNLFPPPCRGRVREGVESMPFLNSTPMLTFPLQGGGNDQDALMQHCILAGGDDYELCFTAPEAHRAKLAGISAALALPLHRIGRITAGSGCAVICADGRQMQTRESGYDHFAR